MIRKIAIENFKGIGDRVEIELKPITLLFGPNSAGKSSVLHALHYAAEIFERRNADADFTVTGGEFVDLGGFANIVHGHDLNRTIWLQFELGGNNELADMWAEHYGKLDAINDYLEIPEILDSYATDLLDDDDAIVEIGIRWSHLRGGPYVSNYRLFTRGSFRRSQRPKNWRVTPPYRLLMEVESDADGKRVHVSNLDLFHLSWPAISEWDARETDYSAESGELPDIDDVYPNHEESVLLSSLRYCRDCFETIATRDRDGENTAPLFLIKGQDSALPKPGESFRFVLKYKNEIVSGPDSDEDDQKKKYAVAQELSRELSCILTTPLIVIGDYLRQFRYLGPIREVPSRDFRPTKSTDATSASGRSRWASGLGAWEELANNGNLNKLANEWLADEKKLDTGYEVHLKNFKELDLSDPLVIGLQTGRAFDDVDSERINLDRLPTASRLVLMPKGNDIELEPSDVGIGVSQVVPVLVTALVSGGGLRAIEQPELHLHPRLQAELGDLFIQSIVNGSSEESLQDDVDMIQPKLPAFLIETHSEHLILRLLRRIRETEKGTVEQHLKLRTDDLAIYYLRQEEDCSKAIRIDVDVKGEFIQPWPDDFFEIDFYERFS